MSQLDLFNQEMAKAVKAINEKRQGKQSRETEEPTASNPVEKALSEAAQEINRTRNVTGATRPLPVRM